jgi:hypothetical protein
MRLKQDGGFLGENTDARKRTKNFELYTHISLITIQLMKESIL